MSKNRYSARVDSNQGKVIAELLKIPGLTIKLRHDDFLIGFLGFTFWIELKNPDRKLKSGGYRKGSVKESQAKIKQEFTGHYLIASTSEEIILNLIAFFDKLSPEKRDAHHYVSQNLRRFLNGN